MSNKDVNNFEMTVNREQLDNILHNGTGPFIDFGCQGFWPWGDQSGGCRYYKIDKHKSCSHPEVDSPGYEDCRQQGFKYFTLKRPIKEPSPEDIRIAKISAPEYRQLTFIFWRHLTDEQRKKILVDLKIVPDVSDEMVKSMSRLALETAMELGKLGLIWDAVMPLIPEDERKKNPFTTDG